jgi:Tfp pilus assembly protein FimT
MAVLPFFISTLEVIALPNFREPIHCSITSCYAENFSARIRTALSEASYFDVNVSVVYWVLTECNYFCK